MDTQTTTDFKKTVVVGKLPVDYRKGAISVFIEIEYKNGRLSISGVEGPLKSGNAVGGAGQIYMHMDSAYLDKLLYAPGWSREKLTELLAIWDRWHLNDLRAGSPRQESFKRDHPKLFVVQYPTSHYEHASRVLKEHGLNPDGEYLHNGEPYRYGHAWLREEVPVEVLAWLRDLPNERVSPWRSDRW